MDTDVKLTVVALALVLVGAVLVTHGLAMDGFLSAALGALMIQTLREG